MTPRSGLPLHACHLCILGAASLLVPRGQRAEWRREWVSELWHVRRAESGLSEDAGTDNEKITSFCLGAFRDAQCLRRQSRDEARPRAPMHGSAAECLMVLTVVLAISFLASLVLPGVRESGDLSHYRVNQNLMVIEAGHDGGNAVAGVPIGDFRKWKARPQRYFDGFAFYQVARDRVLTTAGLEGRWTVAHGSSDLFGMLGLPVKFAAINGEGAQPTMAAILSCEVFERAFGGDARAIGTPIQVGGWSARIAGVATCGAWNLPGSVDAWLLMPDAAMDASAGGRVLGHLNALGRAEIGGLSMPIAGSNSDEPGDGYWCSPVVNHRSTPWGIFLFAGFLAFLALPAITSVAMADYGFSPHKHSWTRRLFRTGFLAAKAALLLPIAYYVPLDAAYWHSSAYANSSTYIQLAGSFVLCLFGMRWVLLDQRHRCPVCLRRVTHPAQVGQVSRMFLAWNGTELICSSGHTLLHIPGMPTSWFGTQRWTYLDGSWEFLFARSGTG